MGKTGSVSAAVLPLGKSVAVGSGLSDPLILCGGRIWLLADVVLFVTVPPTCCQLVLCCSFPIQGEIPLFVGISTFLVRHAHAGTARSLCNHLQASYGIQLSRTCPGRMDGSQGPSPVSKRKPACPVGPFSQAATQDSHGGVPMGSLLSMLTVPGQSMSAHTCPWSVR